MAYGTADIPRVDVICGPGNAYVMEAKRQVYGGWASTAWPVPVRCWSWPTGRPGADWVAADMLAQEEHGSGARGGACGRDGGDLRSGGAGDRPLARSARHAGPQAAGAASAGLGAVPEPALPTELGGRPLLAFFPAPGEDFSTWPPPWSTRTRPSIWSSIWPMPARSCPGAVGRGGVRGPRHPHGLRRLRGRQQPRAAHRRLGPLLVAAVGGHLHAQSSSVGDAGRGRL